MGRDCGTETQLAGLKVVDDAHRASTRLIAQPTQLHGLWPPSVYACLGFLPGLPGRGWATRLWLCVRSSRHVARGEAAPCFLMNPATSALLMRVPARGVNRHHPNPLLARVISARHSEMILTLPDGGAAAPHQTLGGHDATTDARDNATSAGGLVQPCSTTPSSSGV